MRLLEMTNITKKFGENIIANENVNFEVEQGEVHALLGENGAGKSTLMNILCGVYKPTSGEMRLHGKKISMSGAADAQKLGIGMVHQHFMIIQNMLVIENVILGTHNRAVLDLKKAARKFTDLSLKYGMEIDPFAKVSELTVGQQQRLEILKVLYRGAELIILDEPTAILTPEEVDGLYNIIRMLVKEGKTVIFITHKMKEVMEVCNRCTILRNGRSVQTMEISKINSVEQLANMMVGKQVELTITKKACNPGKEILRIVNLECRDNLGKEVLSGINFGIRSGEILGVAGVDGNGQSELVACITGLRKTSGGAVIINGESVNNTSVKEVLKHGVAHIPEDRHRFGIIGDMSVMENLMLMSSDKKEYSKNGIICEKWIKEHCEKIIDEFDVKTSGVQIEAGHLSGGNQQKLVIGRELEWKPELIIAMHPDRGLDIGATKYIQNRLIKERDRGAAVLMVSAELDEIMELSDRILVMSEGHIAGILDATDATKEQIGVLMTGGNEYN